MSSGHTGKFVRLGSFGGYGKWFGGFGAELLLRSGRGHRRFLHKFMIAHDRRRRVHVFTNPLTPRKILKIPLKFFIGT